ncbi:hypothetical protein N7495_009489 [Penicillium taxi]|uniref:uncharacterized protein n=1 Tax=Penicillium taxi TaxID=168475 RepID=UPI002545255C|nr:uncharacterized protein N7495_009489 [Penicillium taxi]KAJ5884979.1 hypothetical protein N7495_009489 [Penicillium taxi]
MIPHSSGGQPWGHPMPAHNGGPTRADRAPPVQYDTSSASKSNHSLQPPSQSQQIRQQPTVVDLTTGPDSQEPPPKRPRLDISGSSKMSESGPNSGEAKSTPSSAAARPPMLWRGRPMWSFQAVMSDIPSSENRGDNATGSRSLSPPPLPVQPWKSALPERLQPVRTREPSPVKQVQTTPYRIEVPSAAPIIKGENVADFTPWTGSQPEDVLNEQTAKLGYSDRTQYAQNESSTARPALYAQLKHRTGLQMLSTVFAAALEKRQTHTVIRAPSTFKPPPRVTLTDNKREAWLRDLANPTVPLRRLSRTIPHGIRGKVLLDQCLGKWIPVARAVWLAKCVGANEIRAFKRKGTNGNLAVGLEVKWVRDWTNNVQQFVEGVLSGPKSSDWKAKMSYAVGLTARLFFDNLLDHDHYLEWFMSSFDSASIATVPVWLLMLGIYWNNIMRYRRRGRRLAELLLEKLRQATGAKLEALQPLIERLSRFVRKLIQENTSSVILPNSWGIYKSQVSSCLDLTDKAHRALFQTLAERNARVQRPRQSKQMNQRSPHQRIIRLLDSIHSAQDLSSISSSCLEAIEDRNVLVSKLLEWIATPFRHGICRVYAGVRLLRKWKASGIDTDDHLMRFLTRANHSKKLNMDNIYHVISELVRSQTFSVGRYLQWLMAKGVTSRSPEEQHTAPDLAGDVGLIAQLPTGRLPEHVRNLRRTLLTRTGLAAQDEVAIIASVKESISCRLPQIFGVKFHMEICDVLPGNLTWAVKAEIGQWLRRGVAEYTRDITSSVLRATIPSEVSPFISALTPDEFYSIRDILETFGDISILADVLMSAAGSDDSIVLASVADTTNCHFDSLSVIGASTDLFRKLVDAYAGMRRFATPSLDLIFSLIELGLRIPSELNAVIILRQDLSRMENKAALAASSPVSDHIPDYFGDEDPLFREKLDQVLLSGNVMDEATLDTIFNTLTKHLESEVSKVHMSLNDTCRYLAQLRSFRPKHFDRILARWVCEHLRSPDRVALFRALPSLIGVGCVTIKSFLSLVKRLSCSSTAISNVTSLPEDLVELLVSRPRETKYLDLVSYRFKLAQQEFLAKNFDDIFEIICDAAKSLDSDDSKTSAKHLKLENSIVILLRELIVRNPECPHNQCMRRLVDQYPAAMGGLQKALDLLLGVDSFKSSNSVISEVEKLASTTDDFSLPFCQLKLQALFHGDSVGEDQNSLVDAMFKTVVADSRAGKLHWVDLVALMSPAAVCQIRERAENAFFAIPLLEVQTNTSSNAPQNMGSLETAKLYLTIIEEFDNTIPDSGSPAVASILVEKMESLLQKIIALPPGFGKRGAKSESPASQVRPDFERSLAFWFSALLRMVIIHRASFMQPPPSSKTNALHEQARLLISIFCIALSRLPGDVLRLFPGADYFPHPCASVDYRPCPGILLQTHALDVAASLIDVFPDEIRHQCSRFLKEKCPQFAPLQNDARFLYLLGPLGDFSTSIPASISSPAGSTSTPTSMNANFPGSNVAAQQATVSSTSIVSSIEGSNSLSNRLRIQQRGRTIGSYPLRPWELLADAAPFVGINDTAVNLGYFDARRVRV